MKHSVAVVGMACEYPEAPSPDQLWENVLAQRRAFRKIPSERLNTEDYFSLNRSIPDCTYVMQAAVIENYAFDRARFRVAGSTYRSADLTHWLALDVAARALDDAGFLDGNGLPREATGVLIGNSLTGEFSRASLLRLRWPYVRRVLDATLAERAWSSEDRRSLLAELEERYKQPFPAIGEETLAGSLSNTIAGRICNYFDLGGGGYTVDGACSSSLLAVANSCSALLSGDLDVVLAGGVDLSIDPFELVGFAKTGALAADEMRVYDARSAGFWPGEGCGVLVLMRLNDAVSQQRRIHAVIHGWGISSDGHGGITRPEVDGQLLALHRAYKRAGFGIDTVDYFEGHGTGTSVGDLTELRALALARSEAAKQPELAFIGSVKANIGHTKAAAGVAGLIKATMALKARVLPPTTGCETPHPEFQERHVSLRVASHGAPWNAKDERRAGVSSMGFGGINAHVVLGEASRYIDTEKQLTPVESRLLRSRQDHELILLGARDLASLGESVRDLLTVAPALSRAEVADLAAARAADNTRFPARAAIVTTTPQHLVEQLKTLAAWLEAPPDQRLDVNSGVYMGSGTLKLRIGYLFPGQAAPANLTGGAWRKRFALVDELYKGARLPVDGDGIATQIAQPAITTASIAGLCVLSEVGLEAQVGVGHSLGELTALHWAGSFGASELQRLVGMRGKLMAELGGANGAMASLKADGLTVEEILASAEVQHQVRPVIAGYNSPVQTVVSGASAEVAAVLRSARTSGVEGIELRVSHAFHSPYMAGAAGAFGRMLEDQELRPPQRTVFSTVTGSRLTGEDDLQDLLTRQITAPVRFYDALKEADGSVDLWIEVGPGRNLSGLAKDLSTHPVISLDAGGNSLRGLLDAVASAYVLGTPIQSAALFADRFVRPWQLKQVRQFFKNPCEEAPKAAGDPWSMPSTAEEASDEPAPTHMAAGEEAADSALALFRQLVAERLELPLAQVRDDHRLLSDLHLNSITVGELVVQAVRHLKLDPLVAPTDYADATLAEVSLALEGLKQLGAAPATAPSQGEPPGIDVWVRPFAVKLVEVQLPSRSKVEQADSSRWRVLGLPEQPLYNVLTRALKSLDIGPGVLLLLPPQSRLGEEHLRFFSEASDLVLKRDRITNFVVVQHGGGGGGFARTLHLEAPHITTCVIDLPFDHPQAPNWVLTEASAARGYTEAHYDEFGVRRELRLQALPLGDPTSQPALGPQDILLVSGGGKGITAECALDLAQEYGVQLVLLGRSDPEHDSELSTNLTRAEAAGVRVLYLKADVTSAEEVKGAVARAERAMGPITAVLHGAGANQPKPLTALREADYEATVAPKVAGARNLLNAVDPAQLRLFLAFGSVIARSGMRGEGDYAVANEWLSHLTEAFQAEHPNCRCLTLEWSVWSGAGMGERLGRVDALMREGIMPISLDDGVVAMKQLLSAPPPQNGSIVVTSRFGKVPTLHLDTAPLPFLRFVDEVRAHYPGIELIVDTKVSADTDPYLHDHRVRGDLIFPAVMGIEAMAQVAASLVGADRPSAITDLTFSRPIVVPKNESIVLRAAALVRASDLVDVVLRCSTTDFKVDHFRATCCFTPLEGLAEDAKRAIADEPGERLPLNPATDLYGDLLFHGETFRCLKGYSHLSGFGCEAEVGSHPNTIWFAAYLPQDLLLGDPAARDTFIHCLQACVPHVRVLPVGVQRLVPGLLTSGTYHVSAQERLRKEAAFIYDLTICKPDGTVVELWEGLELRVLEAVTSSNSWPLPLVRPLLEQQLRSYAPHRDWSIDISNGNGRSRQASSDQLFATMLSPTSKVIRRTDGKPIVMSNDPQEISASHADGLTLAVAGSKPLSCDLEAVVSRPPTLWRDLLGEERFRVAEHLLQSHDMSLDTASTCMWAVVECLKKAGISETVSVTLASSSSSGLTAFTAGSAKIATIPLKLKGHTNPLVFAVLTRSEYAGL